MVGDPEQRRRSAARTRDRRARRSRDRAAAPAPRLSPRNSSRTVSGARPSPSQNAANAGQMSVVRTPPKSTTRAIGFPAMAAQATDGHRRPPRRGLVHRHARRGRAAAELRADRRRALEPHLRGHRRGRAPLGAAPPAARLAARLGSRHGPRAPDHLRPRRTPRSRCRPWSGSARRATIPSTSWGGSTGRSCGRSTRSTSSLTTADAARDRRAGRRHAGRDPRRGSRRGRASASWRRSRTTSLAQLHRWRGQYEKQHTRELPLIGEVHDRLVARIPEQGPATIVHGDYRLDNMILSPSGEVAAVVDWELCTLGDPLADVGLLLVYWGEEGDELVPLMRPATMAPGFPNREDVKARYAERSGRDLERDRLLRRARPLEAGDHPRGRLRPLRRRPVRSRGGGGREAVRAHGRAPHRGRR